MDTTKEEAIEQCKEIAKNWYEAKFKKIKGYGRPIKKRKWVERARKDGDYILALEGTPDKAFVHVSEEAKKAVALRMDKTIIREIYWGF